MSASALVGEIGVGVLTQDDRARVVNRCFEYADVYNFERNRRLFSARIRLTVTH